MSKIAQEGKSSPNVEEPLLTSDYSNCHLTIVITKSTEFSFICLKLNLTKIETDCNGFQFVHLPHNEKIISIVNLGCQGPQSFGIRYSCFLQTYSPIYTLLVGTAAGPNLSLGQLVYVISAFNYEEGKEYEDRFEHDGRAFFIKDHNNWFPETSNVLTGKTCITGSKVVNAGIKYWEQLKLFASRQITCADMEASAYMEANQFHNRSSLGCLKAIVDNGIDKLDTTHNGCWDSLAYVLKHYVLSHLQELPYPVPKIGNDGEKSAETYFANFVVKVLDVLDPTTQKLFIYRVPEPQLASMAYTGTLAFQIKRLKLSKTTVPHPQFRDFGVYRKNEDPVNYYDFPTILSKSFMDEDRSLNYFKFWKKLHRLIEEHMIQDSVQVIDI